MANEARPFWAVLFAATVLLAGCATCRNTGDSCALLAIDAAIPVLLPVGVAAAAFRVVSAPFDPVYPSFLVGGQAVAPVRRFEMPFTVDSMTIDDGGAVTGFPSPATGRVAACVPDHACALADLVFPPPAPRPGCLRQSPDGAYCLAVSPNRRQLVSTAGDAGIATVPSTFGGIGRATVSDRGEVFLPATDGGYDQTNAGGTRHHIRHGTATIFVARLGRQDRVLQITGSPVNNAQPQVLHLLDAKQDREIDALALPSHATFLFGLTLSRDGAWCALTWAPEGKSIQVELIHIGDADITPFGIITAPLSGPQLVFSPSSGFVAVLGSGAHDRESRRRVGVYQLPLFIPALKNPHGASVVTRGG